jgi:hypothetical protein
MSLLTELNKSQGRVCYRHGAPLGLEELVASSGCYRKLTFQNSSQLAGEGEKGLAGRNGWHGRIEASGRRWYELAQQVQCVAKVGSFDYAGFETEL